MRMTKGKSRSRKSNTLVFTSTRSTQMLWIPFPNQLTKPQRLVSHSGTYSCTIEDDECHNVQSMAKAHHGSFSDLDSHTFMNLNFYVSSENKEDSPNPSISDEIEENNNDMNDDGNNYLYGAAVYDHSIHFKRPIYSWQIMRANLDTDGEPSTEAYFKTVREFDWNNCGFDCCPFNDEPDSNGYQIHRDRHDWAFMHAYIRTIPRDFAVDEDTGQIFISWEGFYKNCDPVAHFKVAPEMEWTIGISRLKTQAEDPTCILPKDENGNPTEFNDLHNNFGRCTVPASIVAMGTRGRDLQLPHGGLAVIPAGKEEPAPGVKPRRTFLLSVLEPGKGTHLWAMPENADVTENKYMRQELSTTPLDPRIIKLSIWNGGNIRVHYNRDTGRPNHVCRTVFEKGIRCMPIKVTEDAQSTYVTVTGEEETFLTEEQVKQFCVTGEDVRAETMREVYFEQKTTLVSGLDVAWNEDDGTPEKIYFGCSGYYSVGNLGSVEKDGTNLIDLVPGAHAGDVVFLPQELDPSAVRIPLEGEMTTSSVNGLFSSLGKIPSGDLYGIVVSSALLVTGIVLYSFYKKRFPSASRVAYPTGKDKETSSNSRRGLPVTYMELPVIDSSSSTSTDVSASSSSNDLSFT